MLGFKSAPWAAVTPSGIELAHRTRKRRFRLDSGKRGRSAGDLSLKQLWDRALTAEPMVSGYAGPLAPLMHQNSRTRRDRIPPRVWTDTAWRYPRKVFSGGGLYLYHTPSGGEYCRYKC